VAPLDSELIYGLVRVAVILAIMAPAVYFITRWYGRQQGHGRSIRVQDVVHLGVNRALYVVEWENRRYLIGVSPQAINIIDTVSSDSPIGEEIE
jgi:flagellar biogenesis protein FliO